MLDRAGQFWCYLSRTGKTPKECAALCGVTVRTVQRWKRGTSTIPESAYNLIKVISKHDLATLAPAWRGWFIKDDLLYSPENQPFSAGDIRALPHIRQANRFLEEKLKTPEQYKLL